MKCFSLNLFIWNNILYGIDINSLEYRSFTCTNLSIHFHYVPSFINWLYILDTKSLLPHEQQNNMHAHIVLPRTHRSARFEVLTPTSTYSQLIICMFFFLKFNTKQDFVFISCNFKYNVYVIFKLWGFYHSHPSAGNKQSIYIVSFPAGRKHPHPFARHTVICQLISNFQSCL